MYLDDLLADSVRVEIYADGLEDNTPFCQLMERKAALPDAVNGYLYETQSLLIAPLMITRLRLVAEHCQANSPAEEAHIKWYR